MRLFLAVTLFVGIICSCYGQPCNPNDLQRCINDITELSADKKIFYPRNEQELQETCKIMRKVTNCISDTLPYCLPPEGREQLSKATKGSMDLLNNLCGNGSDFKQRYLKHTPCLYRASSTIEKCSERYFKDVQAMTSKISDPLRVVCCLLDRLGMCQTTVTSFFCGKDAADITYEAHLISSRHLDCSGYNAHSESCILDYKTASCYMKVSEAFQSGLKDFRNVNEQLLEQDLSAEEKTKRSCCKFDEFIGEIMTHAKSVCSSSDADNVLRDVIDPMGIENIRDSCPSKYTYDSMDCASAAISINGAKIIVPFISVLLLALRAVDFMCV